VNTQEVANSYYPPRATVYMNLTITVISQEAIATDFEDYRQNISLTQGMAKVITTLEEVC
jgi:hypothetical protein